LPGDQESSPQRHKGHQEEKDKEVIDQGGRVAADLPLIDVFFVAFFFVSFVPLWNRSRSQPAVE
jgi:hypothetical protein